MSVLVFWEDIAPSRMHVQKLQASFDSWGVQKLYCISHNRRQHIVGALLLCIDLENFMRL